MNGLSLGIAVGLGMLANLLTEYFLSDDLQLPFFRLESAGQRFRIVRWGIVLVGMLGLGLAQISLSGLLIMALLTVTAATDLETKFLPPDRFVYGSTVFGVLSAWFTHGSMGLRDAVIAQGFCFAVVTLGVALFNVCDSGDIKLAMQFGAACGSLALIAQAAFWTWIAACLLFAFQLGRYRLQNSWRSAFKQAAQYRPPEGPLLWCGLMVAVALALAGGR